MNSSKSRLIIALAFSMTLIVPLTARLPVFAHMAPMDDDGSSGKRHHRRHHRGDFGNQTPKIIHDVPNPTVSPSDNDDNRDRPSSANDNSDRRRSRPDGRDGQPTMYSGSAWGDRHRGDDGWHHDWDRRWDDNWGNSWSRWDNDDVVVNRKRTINRTIDVANNQNQETWTSSLAKPGMAIPNFHEVHPWLFRGGQPNQQGLHQLYDMGVRTIVDLRSDPNQIQSEQHLCQEHGMRFVSLPISKSTSLSPSDVQKFVSIVDNAKKNSDGGAVYVHCHHGSDRTGAMVASYRMLKDNFSYKDAYNEMLHYGFDDSLSRLAAGVKKVSQ